MNLSLYDSSWPTLSCLRYRKVFISWLRTIVSRGVWLSIKIKVYVLAEVGDCWRRFWGGLLERDHQASLAASPHWTLWEIAACNNIWKGMEFQLRPCTAHTKALLSTLWLCNVEVVLWQKTTQCLTFCLVFSVWVALSFFLALWFSHTWLSKDENLTFICWPSARLDKANGTSAPNCLCSFHFIILCLAGHISWDKLDSSFSEMGFYLSLIEFLFDLTSLSWPMSLPVYDYLLGKGDSF